MKNEIIGFTLIELLVAMVVIAVLSSIAVPSYKDYVLRAKITEGISSLSGMRVKLEQYFLDNRTYVGACETNTLAPLPNDLKYFTLSCEDLTSNTYTLIAKGLNFEYSIDENGNKSTVEVPESWTKTEDCWVITKNGQCQ